MQNDFSQHCGWSSDLTVANYTFMLDCISESMSKGQQYKQSSVLPLSKDLLQLFCGNNEKFSN